VEIETRLLRGNGARCCTVWRWCDGFSCCRCTGVASIWCQLIAGVWQGFTTPPHTDTDASSNISLNKVNPTYGCF